jgi:hypothetical protein
MPREGMEDAEGVCSIWHYRDKRTGTAVFNNPEVGQIALHKERLGSQIVSHEVTHAMFGVMARKKLDLTKHVLEDKTPGVLTYDSLEEKCCRIVGDMCRAIYSRLDKEGLLN